MGAGKLGAARTFLKTLSKMIFTQVLDVKPLKTFHRCVERYQGNFSIKHFNCLEQFRVMAFAQLTYRESLRDTVTCLRSQNSKLYRMGIRGKVSKSTLADANEVRSWRIYADFTQHLIGIARKLYQQEQLAVDIEQTIYALDSTTIDLCLSVFPWAHLRTAKATVKLHTLIDLKGNIPTFIHISDGKFHDVNVLDVLPIEPGSIYVMDRGYVDFERLYRITRSLAYFVTRAKSTFSFELIYSHPVDKATGLICDQTIKLTVAATAKKYPAKLRRVKYRDPETDKVLVFLTNNFELPAKTIADLYKQRWQGRALLQMDQAEPAHQELLRHGGECSKNPDMDRSERLPHGCHYQEKTENRSQSLHNSTDFERLHF